MPRPRLYGVDAEKKPNLVPEFWSTFRDRKWRQLSANGNGVNGNGAGMQRFARHSSTQALDHFSRLPIDAARRGEGFCASGRGQNLADFFFEDPFPSSLSDKRRTKPFAFSATFARSHSGAKRRRNFLLHYESHNFKKDSYRLLLSNVAIIIITSMYNLSSETRQRQTFLRKSKLFHKKVIFTRVPNSTQTKIYFVNSIVKFSPTKRNKWKTIFFVIGELFEVKKELIT
jgi:hypothetical protein